MTGLLIFGVIVGLALVGAPLFVIIGAAATVAWQQSGEVHGLFAASKAVLGPLETIVGKDSFLAVPLFVGTGAIMTEGGMARRLVDFLRAALGWLPGGMGMAAVGACMGFASISGSSPVTLIAVGTIMFPAMVQARYPEKFALGLVMTAGSLGCLVAPSLILTIYALAVSAAGDAAVEVADMWMAAYVPAFALAGILCIYCFVVGLKTGDRDTFSWRRLWETFRDGVWSLALPLIIYLGIRSGSFAPFKAGSVAFAYALVVTTLIHRELSLGKLLHTLSEAGRLMGMLILIIALTMSLNQLFGQIELGPKLSAWLREDLDLGPVGFLLVVNLFLIIVGALMDSVSATLLFAPILAPIAVSYGIDPVHFGIVFVVNMEIGYLAPPVATNLFVAAALFKKPFGMVSRAILPGLGITTAALVLFMFVPTCSKGLPNLEATGEPSAIWEAFPWDGQRVQSVVNITGASDRHLGVGDATEEAADSALQDDKIEGMSDKDYYFGEDSDDPTAVEAEDAGAGDGGAAPHDAGDGAGDGAGEDDGDGGDDDSGDDLDGVQL